MKKIVKAGGGVVRLAKALGYKAHQPLYRWKHVPSRHLIKVEEITGIPREVLRPELYIREPRSDGAIVGPRAMNDDRPRSLKGESRRS